MKRRGKYQGDLNEWLLSGTLAILLVVVVVWVLCTGGGLIGYASDRRQDIAYNETAAAINGHALEERQLILEFSTTKFDYDEETYLIELREVGGTWQEVLKMIWPYFVLILVIVSSVVVFVGYWLIRDGDYYLADLPRTPRGVLLFFVMFMGWPILAVSWVRMTVHFWPGRVEEREEVKRIAKQQLETERAAKLPEAQEQKAKLEQEYVRYRVSMGKDAIKQQQRNAKAQLEMAEEKLESLDRNLQRLGLRIQIAQTELGEARLEVRRTEGLDAAQELSETRAQEELQKMLQMRGVASMTVTDGWIEFLVKVEVPYHGVLYDFGDYKVEFCQFDWRCVLVRSGVSKDATEFDPDYSTGDGFCFGGRKNTIDEYVSGGRYLEAMTVIIDSLHSVNDAETAEQIPHCFRQIRTIRRTKQKMQRSGQ